jgi:hypothetical protein
MCANAYAESLIIVCGESCVVCGGIDTTRSQAVTRDGELKRDDRCGFRVVDAEKFIEDLISYAYFANGPRSFNPSYCVRHRVVRGCGWDAALRLRILVSSLW